MERIRYSHEYNSIENMNLNMNSRRLISLVQSGNIDDLRYLDLNDVSLPVLKFALLQAVYYYFENPAVYIDIITLIYNYNYESFTIEIFMEAIAVGGVDIIECFLESEDIDITSNMIIVAVETLNLEMVNLLLNRVQSDRLFDLLHSENFMYYALKHADLYPIQAWEMAHLLWDYGLVPSEREQDRLLQIEIINS